jgi:hypothetical protein
MAKESPNKKTKIKHLRRGLSIYQCGRSPYWQARVYDARNKKYVVRSTKETDRLDAAEVAEEILANFKSKQDTKHAAQKDRSFEHFATVLTKINKVKAKSNPNKRAFSDEHKLLYRETDGLVSYFGKYDVGKITSGMVRDYLLFLDGRRDQPLAPSTKTKHCMMIRKVLLVALEDGVIDIIPAMPKQRTKDAPRVTFTGAEYKKLITTAKEIAESGQTKVRGVLVRPEHVDIWMFMVHSFLRPTETELFGLRHCDVLPKGHFNSESDPQHLELTVRGKTGHRISATMPRAYDIYMHLLDDRIHFEPTDYVFMPEYSNRTTAVNTARRIFNHFLEVSGLKADKNGEERSPYSLRHYALQARLRGSKGKVNIYWLAKNAGTSVDQLERFYLKNMALSTEQVKNLHS